VASFFTTTYLCVSNLVKENGEKQSREWDNAKK
jgi:hypothetical protein